MDRLPLMIGLLLMYEVKSQDPSLTINPNPVDEGGQVDITCSYTKEGSFFNVAILHEHDFLCRYANDVFNIYNNSFKERIEHTPQVNYNNHIKITLTNVTKEDSGTYRCTVEGNSQKEATSLLDVYVPPRSMRVFMTAPPPYKENDQYMVNCTFSMYPSPYNELLQRQIKRGDDTGTSLSYIQADSLYEVTIYGWFTLRKEDNGEKPITCELTWKRAKMKYSAQLETPLNVTFAGSLSSSMEGKLLTLSTYENATWPTCLWGSANPPKPIKWIYKDPTVSAAIIGDRSALPSTSHYESGVFHGQTTVSRLTVTREFNQRAVTCCVLDVKLHCKHSEVFNVRFPPTTITITESDVPAGGIRMNLTCTTDSSRPHSNITWDLPSHRQNDTVAHDLIISAGDFGGNISMSVLTFNVSSKDMLTSFTCRVMWNGKEILNRPHVIGAITTTPLVTSTTPQAASTTGDDIEGPHGANKRPMEDNTNLIIGLAVGLVGGVILITVILAVVIVGRKKRKQRQQDRADNAGDKNPETAHDYETVDEELNKVPDKSQQISMIEPEPDYADIGNGNAYTEKAQKTDLKPAPPVSDPPKSPPETLSHDDEVPTYSQVNKSPSRRQKQHRGLPDVVSPGVKGDDPDYSDEEQEGPPVSERRRTKLGDPAIVPAEAEQPPTDEQKHPEIKKTKPVVDKSKKPRKLGKKPGNEPEEPYSDNRDRTPNVVPQKSEPNYAEINPSQKKNVVPTPTERTEYVKVDFSQDHENDEDVTGDTDSD